MIAHRGWCWSLAVSASFCILVNSCGDGAGPNHGPPALNLAARVLVDSASFRSTGDFAIDLVPSDQAGDLLVEETWEISTSLVSPAAVSLATISEGVQPADTGSVASAILIDDSGSMLSSDPERHRAAAAQLFWHDILSARPGNVVALLDFGRGDSEVTAGFDKTNLLAAFTGDQSVLDAASQRIQAVAGGGTPLYRSAKEVISWIDTTTPNTLQRTLVVITDGKPGDSSFKDTLFEIAADRQVRIFAVGVGLAAQQDPVTSAAALVQELATRTGGIYAAAESARELRPILQTLAKAASPPRLLVYLRLTPPPPTGIAIEGTVTVAGTRGTVTAPWSFVAP